MTLPSCAPGLRAPCRALLATLLLGLPALAGDGLGHAADLRFGPLLGGQPVRLDLRTTTPFAPFALFVGIDGAPTPIGHLAPLGVNLGQPFVLFLGFTDVAGRFVATAPTAAGQFGPQGQGSALFVQAVVLDTQGHKVPSGVEATELEPLPAPPGHLADAAGTHLPAGYDQLGGNAVDVADLDHDGHPDLLIATDADVRVWRNDGAGVFADVTATSLAWPGDAVSTLRVADLDGDGAADLLTGGGYDASFSPPDRLWLNDASGVFATSASFPSGEGLASQFEVADMNGDGRPEVLVANGSEAHLSAPGGADTQLVNLGAGQFVEDSAFSSASWNDPDTATTGIRAGDVDDDGDLDLFVSKADTGAVDGFPGQPNLLLLNDGAGQVTDASASHLLPTLSDNTQDARFADLDGDLDLDLVVANSVLGVASDLSGDVYWNQGGLQGGTPGVFLDDPASFLESWTTGDGIRLSTLAEDLDADGDVDVLLTVHDLTQGADQMLFVNQGGAQAGTEGAFVRAAWFDPPGSGATGLGDFICWGAAAFDADHDGDRDLVLCGNGVVTADPTFALTTLFLLNGEL